MKLITLWLEIVGGPIVWLVYLQVGYILASSACVGNKRSLTIAIAAALVMTLALTVIAWRSWHAAGANSITEDENIFSRSRFMALSGLGISALSVLLVLGSAVGIFGLGACD